MTTPEPVIRDLFDLSPTQLNAVFEALFPEPDRTQCSRCMRRASLGPCCGSHGVDLCHGCYRRTHFVEICVEVCTDCAAEGLNPLTAVAR